MAYKVNRYCNHFNFLSLIVRKGGCFRGMRNMKVSRNKKPITVLLWAFYLKEKVDCEL